MVDITIWFQPLLPITPFACNFSSSQTIATSHSYPKHLKSSGQTVEWVIWQVASFYEHWQTSLTWEGSMWWRVALNQVINIIRVFPASNKHFLVMLQTQQTDGTRWTILKQWRGEKRGICWQKSTSCHWFLDHLATPTKRCTLKLKKCQLMVCVSLCTCYKQNHQIPTCSHHVSFSKVVEQLRC